MAGIMPFDIESGVGFGIAQSLRLLQHIGKSAAFFAHFGENEIAGAVDDTGNRLDIVGRQAFAQSLDNRYAAGHSRFKLHHHILLLGQRKNFIAVFSQKLFIGRNHMFAMLDGGKHELFGNIGAAEKLHHNIHFGVLHHFERIFRDQGLRRADAAAFLGISGRHHKYVYIAPQAAADFGSVILQNIHRALADCSQP